MDEEKDREHLEYLRWATNVERVLAVAENSESTDALVLAGEVRRLRGRLEAVCDVLADAAAFGRVVEPNDILEAVRGE